MPMFSEYRPRIAISGRFSESAAALRHAAVVSPRALLTAVWEAGGDPVTLLPAPGTAAGQIASRLRGYDGMLLPGGADINPAWYGAPRSPATREPDRLQDEFDAAAARYALGAGMPLLTVCRGTQLLNAVLGGTLQQDAGESHVGLVHTLTPADPGFLPAGPLQVSCYHHQRIDRLAAGLQATAVAADGTIEAVRCPGARGWVRGVQWHPEDNAAAECGQQQLLAVFTAAAREHALTSADTTREIHEAC